MSLIVPEDSRIEIKFVGPLVFYNHVVGWLKNLPLLFREAYPARRVNSIYFDSHDLQTYEENLSGVSCRTKIRYRWYGFSVMPDVGVLELKRKRNSYGWKDRFWVNNAPFQGCGQWNVIISNIIEQISIPGKMALNHLPQPVIINRYQREYYVSADQKIRATIDGRQQVYDQRYSHDINVDRLALTLPHWMVLEFKFHRSNRELLTQHLNTCPIRVSRNSKYVTGIRSIIYY